MTSGTSFCIRALNEKLDAVTEELGVLVKQVERMIGDNAVNIQDQDEYNKRYKELTEKYDKKKAQYDELLEKINSSKAAKAAFDDFEEVFKENNGPIAEFEEELWGCMVEKVTAQVDGSMVFVFKGGYEVTVE